MVTGGAGYIGSVVSELLIAGGAEVVVFDNLSTGHRDAVHPQATFVEGDLANVEVLKDALARHEPEAVMHFASNTLVGESMQKPFLYLEKNVKNGLSLFEHAIEAGVNRFVLSSTANLFGNATEKAIAEDDEIAPGSPYGESKYMLERMLTWLERICRIRFATLRYFNAAGASAAYGEDHDPETHLIPLVLRVALGQRDNITIFGNDYPTPDGTCVRDYIHVQDLASAHVLALEALKERSWVFNLGNGRGFSVQEVIDVAREVTGHAIPVVGGERRPGDPAILVASSERIRAALGWQPKLDELRSIVETAWQWHRAHPNGFSA
jgi:UDP-glucose 4-epimerase